MGTIVDTSKIEDKYCFELSTAILFVLQIYVISICDRLANMPYLQIYTNISVKEIPKNFHKEMTEIISDLLLIPQKWVVIHIIPGERFTFGGTFEPALISKLCCIGRFNTEDNKHYSEVICAKLSTCLNIPTDRMYITFTVRDDSFVGWHSKTWSETVETIQC